MKKELTDQILVERVKNGDQNAFTMLVQRYQNKIASLVSRYVPSADIQDVVQETFIKVYRSIDLFRGESFFYTWLYRVAVNTAKNYLIAKSRRISVANIDLDELQKYDNGDFLQEIENPENILLSNEIKKVVFDAIESLPLELKEALTLREIDGLSYGEIAERMNTPVGTVRSRIFRAREVINEKLKPLLQQ